MSSFQDVRGAMQKLTSDALVAAGVPFAQHCFDNVQETPASDSAGAYAVISIGFPQTVVEAIGCEGAELITGSCSVLLYTPRLKGMKPAEDVMQAVLKEWVRVNRAGVLLPGVSGALKVRLATRDINGPFSLAPDQRPHQVTSLDCAFTARVD